MRETTEKKWAERVASWRASGLTAQEFCRGKGFAPGSLRLWASKLRRLNADTSRPSHAPRLARVQCIPAAPQGAMDQSLRPPQAALVLHLAQGALAISPGFDPATLASLLTLLAPLPAATRAP